MAASFGNTFPPVHDTIVRVDPQLLADTVRREFRVNLPSELVEFYRLNSSGYFGKNEICLLGLEPLVGGREDLVSWNTHGFWAEIFPKPEDGGPFFFADTCYGDQIGFRWEDGVAVPVLFSVDTFESFRIGDTLQDALDSTLTDRDFVDQERLEKLIGRLGQLPFGRHYAPIVSPLIGGSDAPENFDIIPPRMHLTLALAVYKAL